MQVKEWEKKSLPPKPEVGSDKGFAEGKAKRWSNHIFGESHELVLPRVLKKSRDPRLKRPPVAEYSARDCLLETDQKVIDSLPEEQFYSSIGFTKNAGNLF